MIERIKELMKKEGINGAQLSAKIGISKNAISEWSSGKAKPGTEAIIKIANFFNVTTDFILTGKSERQNFKPDEEKLLFDYKMLSHQGKEYIRQQMAIALNIYSKSDNVSDMENAAKIIAG